MPVTPERRPDAPWWPESRYGLWICTGLGTVPAFAPIGLDAVAYGSHVGADGSEPLVETLQHHADRWSHVHPMGGFAPLLALRSLDPAVWVALAAEGGMGHLVTTARSDGGFCWWDAPGTGHSTVRSGPGRDVVAEVFAAVRAAGLRAGVSCGPPAPGTPAGTDPQVVDLITRHDPDVLWSATTVAHPRTAHPPTDAVRDAARTAQRDLLLDQGWAPGSADVLALARCPDTVLDRPWELRAPIGRGFGHNRAETAEHRASAGALVDLLTEVVAKGGSLLLGVGPDSDGVIPALDEEPIRQVGAWLARFPFAIRGSRPFDVWGDAQVRYTVPADPITAPGGARTVTAIDLSAGQQAVFAALVPAAYEIHQVEDPDGAALHWEQGAGGLVVTHVDGAPSGLAGVYRLALSVHARPVTLFEPEPVAPRVVDDLVATTRPGEVVQLGEGDHVLGVAVPPGVTVRGLGLDRTRLVLVPGPEPDATLIVGSNAAIEHLRVESPATAAPPALVTGAAPVLDAHQVRVALGDGARATGCFVEGTVEVRGDGAAVRSCVLQQVVARGVDRVAVAGCVVSGARAPDEAGAAGIAITGGMGHALASNEVSDHRDGIRVTDAAVVTVRANRVDGGFRAIEVDGCESATVHANVVRRATRAVSVRGGRDVEITATTVTDGDSGCVVHDGATEVAVHANRWERCRIGLLAWDAGEVRARDNDTALLRHPDTITGP